MRIKARPNFLLKFALFAGLVLTCASGTIRAAENVSTHATSSPEEPIPSSPAPEAGLGFYSYSYLYPPGSGKNANFFSLTGYLKAEKTGSVFQVHGDFQGVAVVKPATTWTIEAPEAFIGTSPELSRTVSLRLGRELKHWSHLDEDFQLGIWQPRFRWDYVHPESIGLAGAYLDVQTKYFQFTAFASPLSVPDRGIPIEFKDRGIYTIDPYFVSPATSLSFEGIQTPVTYQIQKPDTSQILFHPGGSLMARAGAESGPWASAAYAFKPMNQLLFSYTGIYNGATGQEGINATLYPRIAYDRLLSLETGYEGGWFGGWISALQDNPIDNGAILGDDTQVVSRSNALSPAAEFRLGSKYNPTRFRLSALRQWGGNEADSGPDATGQGSVFENRYFSQTAGVITAESPLEFLGFRNFSAKYRLLWDIEHRGNIQSTDVYYLFHRTLLVNVGTDILTSNEDASAPDPISRYRANDRVRLGVSYVF